MPNTKGQGDKFKIKATNTFPMASFPRGLGHVTQGYPLLHMYLLQLYFSYSLMCIQKMSSPKWTCAIPIK